MKTYKFEKAPSLMSLILNYFYGEAVSAFKWLLNLQRVVMKKVVGIFSSSKSESNLITDEIIDEISESTTVLTREIRTPQISACFSGIIYKVSVKTKIGVMELNSNSKVYAGFVNRVINISKPEKRGEFPELLKVLSADFRLDSHDNGRVMLNALNAIYSSDYLFKSNGSTFENRDNYWEFLLSSSGEKFTMEADENGKIISVHYSQN